MREALFDILAFDPPGAFLDLFSGSGAVGLEAASRGWRSTCVDLSREAAGVISRNARRLGLDATVVRADALDFARRSAAEGSRFAVVFAAPPYPLELSVLFAELVASGVAAPGGRYILQHPSGLALPAEALGLPDGAALVRRRYGSNAITLIRVPGVPNSSQSSSQS